ncbi:MAG: YlbF family regulator [Armatimonadetes bacterium]|nr:YlbF family regulator [Armatimonadota bacterium]
MADYEEVLERARALGRAINGSKVVQDLRAIEEKIEQNEAARTLHNQHRELALKMARLEAENKPIEPEDKRRLAELVGRLRSDPLFQQLLRVRVEHEDLMRRVNEQISEQLVGE